MVYRQSVYLIYVHVYVTVLQVIYVHTYMRELKLFVTDYHFCITCNDKLTTQLYACPYNKTYLRNYMYAMHTYVYFS